MKEKRDKIEELAISFRTAIEVAKDAGEFDSDFLFPRFPCGCCGDAADLLGEFFLENGIKSYYVCGNRYFDNTEEGTQSHAWLLVDNLIVDITGDQFKARASYYNYDKKVFVGTGDDFHALFRVEKRDMHIFTGIKGYNGICRSRLFELYQKIKKYIAVGEKDGYIRRT